MKRMKKIYDGGGMRWEDGDIPKCDYCGSIPSETVTLYGTAISGEVVCDNEDCLNNMALNQLEEIEEVQE